MTDKRVFSINVGGLKSRNKGGREKQAQKTIDSASSAIKRNSNIMAKKLETQRKGGFATSNEGLYNQNIKSKKRKARAQKILYGNKVGPKKPKLKPGN